MKGAVIRFADRAARLPRRRDPEFIMRDQHTLARRARLAAIQTRVLKVRPFGIDAPEAEARS